MLWHWAGPDDALGKKTVALTGAAGAFCWLATYFSPALLIFPLGAVFMGLILVFRGKKA